jgi:transcriptional regulator with XRE-family HTH domain
MKDESAKPSLTLGPSDESFKLGPVIGKFMTELNLTDAELGSRIGVTESTVNRWRSGDQGFQLKNLVRLANAFQIQVATLCILAEGKDPAGLSPEERRIVDRYRQLPEGMWRELAFEMVYDALKSWLKRARPSAKKKRAERSSKTK